MNLTDVLILTALVVFLVIRRVRRTYTRRKVRIYVVAPMLLLVGCGAAYTTWPALRQPALAPYVCVGLAAGILLGLIVVGNADLRCDSKGLSHKPHPWLGSLLLLVFLAFLAYRVWGATHLPSAPAQAGLGSVRFMSQQTPVFVLLRTTLLSCFLTHAIGILYRWRRLKAQEAV